MHLFKSLSDAKRETLHFHDRVLRSYTGSNCFDLFSLRVWLLDAAPWRACTVVPEPADVSPSPVRHQKLPVGINDISITLDSCSWISQPPAADFHQVVNDQVPINVSDADEK